MIGTPKIGRVVFVANPKVSEWWGSQDSAGFYPIIERSEPKTEIPLGKVPKMARYVEIEGCL